MLWYCPYLYIFFRLYICQQMIVIGTNCMNFLCHMTWWIHEYRAQPYKVPFRLCLYHWHSMAHRTRHTIANGKCKTLTFKVLAHSMYVLRYLLFHRHCSFGCFSDCVFTFYILFYFCVLFLFFYPFNMYNQFVVILYMNKKCVFFLFSSLLPFIVVCIKLRLPALMLIVILLMLN